MSDILLPGLWTKAPVHADIVGIDFSSAPSARKPIQVAHAHIVDMDAANRRDRAQLSIHVDYVQAHDSLDSFCDWLNQAACWVGAFDMPFGLSRHVVDTLGWPGSQRYDGQTWADFVRYYSQLSREELRLGFQVWCDAHPVGHKFAHRATDVPAKSSPSMKWVNPPVAFMLHAGSRALLDAGVSIPGCHVGSPKRIALEAYPGWVARELVGAYSYKTDDVQKQNEARARIRNILCDKILSAPVFGVNLTADTGVVRRMRQDPKGDVFDAVLCCVQAAHAYEKNLTDPCFGLPPDMDPLESWIAAVPWSVKTPRRHRLPPMPPQDVRDYMASHLPPWLIEKFLPASKLIL